MMTSQVWNRNKEISSVQSTFAWQKDVLQGHLEDPLECDFSRTKLSVFRMERRSIFEVNDIYGSRSPWLFAEN